MNTLLLDTVTWDLVVDSSGNIAMATEPYALAQDAASACKLFQGELWYDTDQGIPYFQAPILGAMPPLSLIRKNYERAANGVPDIESVKVFIAAIGRDRVLSGQVQVTSSKAATTGKVPASVAAPTSSPVSLQNAQIGVPPKTLFTLFTLDFSVLG